MCSIPVKVFPESAAHTVESDRIDAAVGECKAETQNAKIVPESVVVLLRSRMDVKPQHEYVLREETNGEHNDECHYHLRYLFTGLYLFHLKASVHWRTKRCVIFTTQTDSRRNTS